MIRCHVVTPTGVYNDLETEIVNVGTIDGARGILPNHMDVVMALDISKMALVNNGKRTYYAIGKGMLYFSKNVATILVDSIESQEEIDLKRAEEAKERAMSRLANKDENIDIRRAEIALKKAMTRIDVKNMN